MHIKFLKEVGPGAMVAAAFIGPGTITTASIAGMSFGYELLWVVILSTSATIVLQLMVTKIGILAQMGTGEAIRHNFQHSPFKYLVYILVVAAIFIGNAAYEAGNIVGTGIGVEGISKIIHSPSKSIIYLIIGVMVFFLLNTGKYKVIEKILVGIVAFMGLSFLITAVIVQPDWKEICRSVFYPKIPEDGLMMILSLMGTTIVPYNLFLHANTAKLKWPKSIVNYKKGRLESILSIGGGGIITCLIIITVASIYQDTVLLSHIKIEDIIHQLHAVCGDTGSILMYSGYFFAGLSSSITAPLAAAIAISELIHNPDDSYNKISNSPQLNDEKWNRNHTEIMYNQYQNKFFKYIWIIVLFSGLSISVLGYSPKGIILFAQITNSLILPILVFILLKILNDKKVMGEYTNSKIMNVIALFILATTLVPILKLTLQYL